MSSIMLIAVPYNSYTSIRQTIDSGVFSYISLVVVEDNQTPVTLVKGPIELLVKDHLRELLDNDVLG